MPTDQDTAITDAAHARKMIAAARLAQSDAAAAYSAACSRHLEAAARHGIAALGLKVGDLIVNATASGKPIPGSPTFSVTGAELCHDDVCPTAVIVKKDGKLGFLSFRGGRFWARKDTSNAE